MNSSDLRYTNQKQHPEISIIIPVYQVEAFLAYCLDSILAQTFNDYEIICVNDGSTDKSSEILAHYAQKDHRIIILNQTNMGLSAARNAGVAKAKGKYILFVDSDDTIHPQLLEITHHMMIKHDADLVCFQFNKTDFHNLPLKSFDKLSVNHLKCIVSTSPFSFYKKKGKFSLLLNVWSKLYKKSLIQDCQFDPALRAYEDVPYCVKLMGKQPKTVFLAEPLYYYTFNEGSITHKPVTVKHIEAYHRGLNEICEYYKKIPNKSAWHHIIHKVFPTIFKHQLNYILRANDDDKTPLWTAFANELKELSAKGCVCLRGNRLDRYLTYKKLIKKDGKI